MKAADSGDDDTIEQIIEHYALGRGVKKNLSKVREWLKKLSKDKLPETLYKVDRMSDGKTAIKFLTESAELGNALAMMSLAEIFCLGKGVPQDFSKAVGWYEKVGESFSDKLHPDIFGEGFVQAGNIFYTGDGVEQSYEKAFEFYECAAAICYIKGKIHLGKMYYHGLGTERNFKKVFELLNAAATHREKFMFVNRINSVAREYVGRMYERSEGVEQELQQALKFYALAAEDSRNTEAMYKTADMYYLGIGTKQSLHRSLKYYKKVAQHKDSLRYEDVKNKVEFMNGRMRSLI